MVVKREEATAFLTEFNPSRQIDVVQSNCAFSDNFETLTSLSRSYGYKVSSAWLFAQISDLNEFCGVRQKMQPEAIKSFAEILATKYGYLTVGELMLFFFNCKSGEYGEFYGCVDPVLIGRMLRDFLRIRWDVKDRMQKKRNDEERNERNRDYEADLAKAKAKGYKSVLEMGIAEGTISKDALDVARRLNIGGLGDED